MRKDIQDALLSVEEVAVFAWSLLELLLTRILPLAGFLAGHLLLQLGRLLASIVIAAAGRVGVPQAELYSYDVQAGEVIEEDIIVPVGKEDGDHHQDDLESSNDELEERPESILSEESLTVLPASLLTHDEDGAPDVQASASISSPAAAATVPDVAAELADHVQHVAESVPPDGQMIDHNRSDTGRNEAESENVLAAADVDVERRLHGVPEQIRSTGIDQGDEKMSRRRILRVLPPSMSQIRRTLMQRSRRASASPSPGGGGGGGSSSMPSPAGMMMKKAKKKYHNISPRSRKLASPAIKSSPSYNNFVGKFRRHFLLDPAA